MIKLHAIENSIEKGLYYLENHQYPNGEFCCYIAQDVDLQKDCLPDTSIFATTLICNSLLSLQEYPAIQPMLGKAGWLIKSHQLRGGVWDYYTGWHRLYKIVPPDVDDTVFASQLLNTLNIEFTNNIPQLLSNRNRKGLFYTWFLPRVSAKGNKTHWLIGFRMLKSLFKCMLMYRYIGCKPNDVDAVVNANVLYYLGYNEKTAPIIPYLISIVDNELENNCDNWYHNPFAFYYFVSRNYTHCPVMLEPIKQKMTNRILSTIGPNGCMKNSSLDTALGIVSLLNINYTGGELEKAISYLISEQYKTGEWQRKALYHGGTTGKGTFGSEELTTGFCLEALAKYKQYLINTQQSQTTCLQNFL